MARARNTAASRKHVEDESSPEVVYDTEWSATPLLTFTVASLQVLPSLAVYILLVRMSCQLLVFLAEIEIREVRQTGSLRAFCYGGCYQSSWLRVAIAT
jgi:hypothetical protein